MFDYLRKPDPLVMNENKATNLQRFVKCFDIFIGASDAADKSEKQKCAIFLNLAGEEAIEVAENFTYAEGEDKECLEVLKRKFKELCDPDVNVIEERLKFNARCREPSESMSSFIASLRTLAKTCNYKQMTDEMIRDRIVGGIQCEAVTKQMLKKKDLTLDDAVEICKAYEVSNEPVKDMNQSTGVFNSLDSNGLHAVTTTIQKHSHKSINEVLQNGINCDDSGDDCHEASTYPAYDEEYQPDLNIKVESNSDCGIEQETITSSLENLNSKPEVELEPFYSKCSSAEEKTFECKYCNKVFGRKASLTIHMKSHTGDKASKKKEKERSLEQTLCYQSFKKEKSLKMHNEIEMPIKGNVTDKVFECEVCHKIHKTRARLKNHMVVHSNERPYVCDVCGKRFKTQQAIKSHSETHTEERPLKCKFCEKTYRLSVCLDVHMRTHTGDKPFQCAVCGKCFAQNSSLINHKRIHTGERPFQCTICEKSFQVKSYLLIHERVHTGNKPFVCNECGQSFKFLTSFKKHTRTKHTVERPYSCTICDKSFNYEWDLKHHMRVHSVKPYVCKFCDKRFHERFLLTRHERIHTGETPFKCSICDKGFARNDYCQKHMATVHGHIVTKKAKLDTEHMDM